MALRDTPVPVSAGVMRWLWDVDSSDGPRAKDGRELTKRGRVHSGLGDRPWPGFMQGGDEVECGFNKVVPLGIREGEVSGINTGIFCHGPEHPRPPDRVRHAVKKVLPPLGRDDMARSLKKAGDPGESAIPVHPRCDGGQKDVDATRQFDGILKGPRTGARQLCRILIGACLLDQRPWRNRTRIRPDDRRTGRSSRGQKSRVSHINLLRVDPRRRHEASGTQYKPIFG